LEAQSVSDFYISEDARWPFKDILRRTARDANGTKRARQTRINDVIILVKPYHGDREEDEEHVDGGVDAILPAADQQDAFVLPQGATERQPAQPTEKRRAPAHATQQASVSRLVPYLFPLRHPDLPAFNIPTFPVRAAGALLRQIA
jgi:hypothetical protein